MYMARRRIGNHIRYFLSESYPAEVPEENGWLSRDLFDLGPDPRDHLCYPGGSAFYIDPGVEDALSGQGAAVDADELEAIFWPFVKPEIRHRLRGLIHRGACHIPRAPLSKAEETLIRKSSTGFDKRRYYFLRCGRTDLGQLNRVPPKLFRKLLYKSRDELEQWFRGMERELHPRQVKPYVIAGFNLPRRLEEIGTAGPNGSPRPANLDQLFTQEICRVNQDARLWGHTPAPAGLRPDLHRYVWMFFDYELPQPNPSAAQWQDFMDKHRQHRPPAKVEAALAEVRTLFGMDLKELKLLDRRDFIRLYRRRARKLHPDTGGRQEQFVRLTNIYRHLLQTHF